MATLTVQDTYNVVTKRLLESGGFQLGLVTDTQFLIYFADVINDFTQIAGISKSIITQSIQFGVSDYIIPDTQLMVEHTFVAGRYLNKTTLEELDNREFSWKNKLDFPTRWHEDGLPIKSIELSPSPNFNGVAYGGTGAPFVSPTADFLPADKNLTTVGLERPVKTTYTLTDTIPILPNCAVQYLAWGILTKIWSDNSEMKDAQRAAYASSRYYEGVQIFKAIMLEAMEEDHDSVAAF